MVPLIPEKISPNQETIGMQVTNGSNTSLFHGPQLKTSIEIPLKDCFFFVCVLKVLGVVICEDNIVQNQKMRFSSL